MNSKEIQAIYHVVEPFIKKTPLIRSKALEQLVRSPHPLFFKCENKQFTGSFKVRGSAYCLARLSDEEKIRGIVARSSGNFSAAVAYLTHQMGIKSTLVLAESTPVYKREKSQRYLSEVVIYGQNHQESMSKVLELQRRYHYTLLHPYDDFNVIRGQGTLAYEIFKEEPAITSLVIPLGGGGLAAGCAQTFKILNPSTTILTLEPTGANDYFLSRREKKRIALDQTTTIADGLRAPQVGDKNWPLLNEYVDETYHTSDALILKAMHWIYQHHQWLVEPSAALSIAPLLDPNFSFNPKGPTAFILTGGNIAESDFFNQIETLKN